MCWNVFSDFFCTSTLFRLLIKKNIYIYIFCVPRIFSFCSERHRVSFFLILVLYRSFKFWYRDNPNSYSWSQGRDL